MEQKYLRLQKIDEKSEEDARVHEHKAQKMTKGYAKVKGKNENLYIAVDTIFFLGYIFCFQVQGPDSISVQFWSMSVQSNFRFWVVIVKGYIIILITLCIYILCLIFVILYSILYIIVLFMYHMSF